MKRYIVPKIFCALGALVIFIGIFISGLNISLGDYLMSCGIAVGITLVVLLFAILAFKMKTSHKKKICKIIPCFYVEVFSIVLFALCGLASLMLFNHCITVWQQTEKIQKFLNVHQLENMLPEYEEYADQRIVNYERQLNDAIVYKDAQSSELINLGFNTNESLEGQKARKIQKLKQVLRPHTYKNLTDTITASIERFVCIVDEFSPITAPKNITRIEEWANYYEKKLNTFSQYKMKGEGADDFHFERTFDSVKEILTGWNEGFFSPKRFTGYFTGIISLILMLFPYFWGNRSIKLQNNKHSKN